MRELIAKQQATHPKDAHAFFELDEEMHKTIAQHAGRDYAWRVSEGIKSQLNRLRFLNLSYDFSAAKSELVAEHIKTVDAIEASNPDLAAKHMQSHLRSILKAVPMIVKQHPDYFTDV